MVLPGAYSFGGFVLDRNNWTLYRNGTPVKIEPKTFDILLLLIERAPNVVSKEEIFRKIWGDVVIEEHGLTRNISLLRAALGDKSPYRYIETVMGEGYRFCSVPDDADNSQANDVIAMQRETREAVSARQRKKRYYVAVLMAIAALLATVFVSQHRATPVYVATQLTTRSAEAPVSWVAISRAAKRLAISHGGKVYISDVYSKSQYELTLSPELSVNEVEWFPDSVHLLVSAANSHTGQSGLWIISTVDRQTTLSIKDVHISSIFPDGKQIAYIRNDDELWIASSDGSNARLLARAPDNTRFWSRPAISRDMKYIVVPATSTLTRYSTAISYPLDTGIGIVVYNPGSYINDLVLLDEHTMLVARFPDQRIMESEIAEVPIDLTREKGNAEVRRIAYWPGYVSHQISISEDRNTIALLNGRNMQHVVMADLNDTASIANAEQMTHNQAFNYAVAWYPDSSAILIESAVAGHYGIYSQKLDSTEMQPLARGGVDYIRPVIDSSQNWLFYFSFDTTLTAPDTTSTLMRMPLNGGDSTVVSSRRDRQWRMRCAAKAKRCVLAENTEHETVFVEYLPDSGQRTELARIKWEDTWPAYDWDLSPDGSKLAHLVPMIDTNHVNTISIITLGQNRQRWSLHLDKLENLQLLRWDAQGKGFYVTHSKVSEETICLIHINLEGEARKVRCDNNVPNNFGISSPDGKHFAFHKWILNDNIWLLQRKN